MRAPDAPARLLVSTAEAGALCKRDTGNPERTWWPGEGLRRSADASSWWQDGFSGRKSAIDIGSVGAARGPASFPAGSPAAQRRAYVRQGCEK